MEVEKDEAVDLAEVETGRHLFEGLFAWARGFRVDCSVVFCQGEDLSRVVEGAVFTIDGHGRVGREALGFGDAAGGFHVCSVAAGAEDGADDCVGVVVGGGYHCADGVVDECDEADW